MLTAIERFLFQYRAYVLGGLAVITLLAAFSAAQIRLTSDPSRLVPEHHPWIEASEQYLDLQPERRQVFVRLVAGDAEVTPGTAEAVIDAVRVSTGLPRDRIDWQVIDGVGVVLAATLPRHAAPDANVLDQLQRDLAQTEREQGIGLELAGLPLRQVKAVDAARKAFWFFGLGLMVTSVAVFLYARSVRLTALAVLASLVSVIWQLAIMQVFGLTLDPVILLIPFVVYAIGLSHGMQQINVIAQDVCRGTSAFDAARHSFRRLAPPGLLAFVTDLAGFVTLLIVPVSLVRDMAALAAIGIALKIISNLIMLPLIASYFSFSEGYVERMNRSLARRLVIVQRVGALFQLRTGWIIIVMAGVILVAGGWLATGRTTGAVEMNAQGPFGTEAPEWAEALSLDRFSLFVLAPANSCEDANLRTQLGEMAQRMNVIAPSMALGDAPPGSAYVSARGLAGPACAVFPVVSFADQSDGQLVGALASEAQSIAAEQPDSIILAGGTVGRAAAVADTVAQLELPSFAAIFGIIALIVFVSYRDLRAVVCCVVPLAVASVIGYAALVLSGKQLTLVSLPILILAVGIGVDYAFYFYSRLRVHLAKHFDMVDAFSQAMEEAGAAVIVTGTTIALGTLMWLFSPLSLQAEMGALLAVVFLANMIVAVTLLPALAVVLDHLFPRRLAMGAVRP